MAGSTGMWERCAVDLPQGDQVGVGFAAMNLGRPIGEDKPSSARSPAAIFPDRATQNPRRPFGPHPDLMGGAQIDNTPIPHSTTDVWARDRTDHEGTTNMTTPTLVHDEASTQEFVDDMRARLSTLRQEHERFRTLVRDRAINGFRDSQWGLQSLNETLERLGLNPHEPKHVSRSDVDLEFQVEIDDDDSYQADTALDQLKRDDVRTALRHAVASVLAEHMADGPAVTITDAYFRVQTGYTSRVMV